MSRALPVLALVALTVSSVRAQDADPEGTQEAVAQEAVPQEAVAQEAVPQEAVAEEEEGRALFVAGRAAYDTGRFEQALGHFEAAYELTGRAELLYNVGQAADRARQDDKALDAFQRFLEARPDTTQRAYVEGRIEVLRSQILERQGPERLDRVEPIEQAEPSRSAGPWILAASGGAVAIAGVVMTIVGVGARNNVEDAEPGTPFAEVSDDASRAPALIRGGQIIAAVGVLALGTGILWGVLGNQDDDVQVSLGPGGVQLRGRF